jgi:hypothetical protein
LKNTLMSPFPKKKPMWPICRNWPTWLIATRQSSNEDGCCHYRYRSDFAAWQPA